MKDVLSFDKDQLFSQSDAQKAMESFFQDSPLMLGIVELVPNDIIHLSDNPASAKFFGTTQAALRGRSASELGVSSDVITEWTRHYQESQKFNRPVKFRHKTSTKDKVQWYQVTVSFLGMSLQGKPRFSYFLEDISNLVEEENQRKIRENEKDERQFQMLANAMTQMAWMANANGNIFWYNNRWYEFTGTSLEEIDDPSYRKKFLHPDYYKTVTDFLNEAWKKNEPWELTFPLKSKEGKYRWFLTRAVPIMDHKGKIIRWFGTNTDITEQQNLINEIEFQKSRFETVMKQMPAAVIIGEAPSGKLVFANDKMHEVWGHEMLPSEDISQYSEWVAFHPDGSRYKGEDWPLARSIKYGEIVDNEDTDVLRGDGKRAVIRLSSAPVRDRSGQIVAGVVICQDVTESIQTHNSLLESETRLREAVVARDEFLSIASHELKTPLTSLILNGQMMKKQMLKDEKTALTREKVEKFVDHSNKQTARLSRLIDDMLEISRLRTGKLSVEKTLVNLNDILIDLKLRFDELFLENTGESLHLSLKEDITGLWDRLRLEQTFTNLLTNALKYGNKKPVSITVEHDKDFAIISFIDKGIGIKSENKEKIFQRFERAGISANEISGLGLGLYIAKQIVLAHGGEICVQSQINEGSIFSVKLPLHETTQSLGVDLQQN